MIRNALALLPAAFAASAVSAQRPIHLGETVAGVLASSDSALSDGSHFHHYTYRARGGERVRIILQSRDFWPYVAVGVFSGDACTYICRFASEGTPGAGAGLVVPMNRAGDYLIRVNSQAGGETGAYTLRLDDAPVAPYPGRRGELDPGERMESHLDESDARLGQDESFYEDWTFEPDFAGEVMVETSSWSLETVLQVGTGEGAEFEPLPTVEGGAQRAKPEEPHHSLDPYYKNVGSSFATTSRTTFSVEAGRRYTIRANARRADDGGDYVIEVRRIFPVPAPNPVIEGAP